MPRLEPFAETKLVMEGLALANFRGLEKILAQKPQENQGLDFCPRPGTAAGRDRQPADAQAATQ